MTPEGLARENIDRLLAQCGWLVQDYQQVNLGAGPGIALHGVPPKTGPCDYLLLVDRTPAGVLEAKREGTTLSGAARQSDRYASGLPERLAVGQSGRLPFLYESTGVGNSFCDEREPAPHQPIATDSVVQAHVTRRPPSFSHDCWTLV